MFSHSLFQQLHQLRSLSSEDGEEGISMIRVYAAPFFSRVLETTALVLEVASIPVAAEAFLGKSVASLGLV
jgi:hypothetical protein